MKREQGGFTIIELLVTLFVAAIFLIAGYQLYIVVLRADGQTHTQTIAQNTAQDYLERYRASVPSPCVASTPLTDSPITVEGLVNTMISVTVSCPKSGASISTVSQINVVIKYGNQNPQQQIAYSAWSYLPDVCGDGYVLVPGNASLGTATFCVMKYEAKNVNGIATSQAAGTPWVNISQNNAIITSSTACDSCHLITEAEWMTIAANVLSVSSNWSGGTVGSGYIYNGHTNSNPAAVLAASTDDSDSLVGITGGIGNGPQYNNRRTLSLTNGEVVWDLAGNAWEWVNATIPGGMQPGLPGESSPAWKEWNASGLLWNGFPTIARPSTISAQAANWSTNQGIGDFLSNYGETTSRAFNNGGAYNSTYGAGVLALSMNSFATPDNSAYLSFRVAKGINDQPEQLPPPTSCPTGFIPIPGDARFGTIGFCVMKYEAKNVGGVATSQAAGTPWASISQTSAIATSKAACTDCHLISEAEWMTIAANIASVSSNWTGGSIGSGQLYVGHSDNGPASTMVASIDDSQGYTGETNQGGTQRRTFTLSNGQIIWDFAGNIWEWTSGTLQGSQQPGLSGETAYAYKQWNNTALLINGLSPNSSPTSISPQAVNWSGIGYLYSNYGETGARGFRRGGAYDGWSGVTTLALYNAPSDSGVYLGFRVAK